MASPKSRDSADFPRKNASEREAGASRRRRRAPVATREAGAFRRRGIAGGAVGMDEQATKQTLGPGVIFVQKCTKKRRNF